MPDQESKRPLPAIESCRVLVQVALLSENIQQFLGKLFVVALRVKRRCPSLRTSPPPAMLCGLRLTGHVSKHVSDKIRFGRAWNQTPYRLVHDFIVATDISRKKWNPATGCLHKGYRKPFRFAHVAKDIYRVSRQPCTNLVMGEFTQKVCPVPQWRSLRYEMLLVRAIANMRPIEFDPSSAQH